MNVVELIEAASKSKGSALELAREMRKAPARLSEWKKGKAKPDASEIAFMAKVAGLPVLITVAMVESQLYPESADLWAQALGEVKDPGYLTKYPGLYIMFNPMDQKSRLPGGFFSPCNWRRRGTVARFAGGFKNA